jgi:hypothetical protein
MVDRRQFSSADQSIALDVRGLVEWIDGVTSGERPLHVYELAPSDWLVSEVGRTSEGRATDLKQAIDALSAQGAASDWWDVVPGTLDGGEDRPSDVYGM